MSRPGPQDVMAALRDPGRPAERPTAPARAPAHEPGIIRAIARATTLHDAQLATVLGLTVGRLQKLRGGWIPGPLEARHFRVMRQRAEERAPEAARLYFLRLHEAALREGCEVALARMVLGVDP